MALLNGLRGQVVALTNGALVGAESISSSEEVRRDTGFVTDLLPTVSLLLRHKVRIESGPKRGRWQSWGMNEIGFHALQRPKTPTERLEEIKAKREAREELTAIGGFVFEEEPEWNEWTEDKKTGRIKP